MASGGYPRTAITLLESNVCGARIAIRLVFRNIDVLGNAMKYSAPDLPVHLIVRVTDGTVESECSTRARACRKRRSSAHWSPSGATGSPLRVAGSGLRSWQASASGSMARSAWRMLQEVDWIVACGLASRSDVS